MRRLGIIADSVPFDDICRRLPSLVSLSLQENFGIVGDISGVVTCIGLQHLTLASNGFYGVVPNLSPLTKLRTLNIAWNHFIGMFPWASLTAMPGLVVLLIGNNPFSLRIESFPDKVTKLTNLTVLDL
jgi:hypothetical protein